ncbi:MAG: AMP-binding protein, partial [Myxococcota bacterium]
MKLNLGTILQATASEKPDKTAIILDERRLSYAELERGARGVAASLRARGVEPSDSVALLVPNVPEFT